MEPTLRRAFNEAYSETLYTRYRERLERAVGPVPFRLAETPAFLPTALRDRLEAHARSVLARLSEPSFIKRMRAAVPARFDTPHMDELPSCAQVDFAVVRGDDGGLDGRVVELQAFPSLYGFTVEQARAWNDVTHVLPGISELRPFFSGLDEARGLERLRATVVADGSAR